MKKTAIILIVTGILVILSCSRHRYYDPGPICTMEYRILTVSVRDIYANPVILSDYSVRKTSTGEIIDFSGEDPYFDSIYRLQGLYIICTDGKMQMTSQQGTGFEFHGTLDSTEVINEKYIIGNDECHVLMISGQPEIVIPE
jgi:hypothetical protein